VFISASRSLSVTGFCFEGGIGWSSSLDMGEMELEIGEMDGV
jgi:hypothetical protein